ncbi:MAG: hypothetical protein ACYCY9_11835 [Thiobacillus sp.]
MTISVYKDHPIWASVKRILELQNAPEFSDPSIADNETYAFARDKVFGIAKVIQVLLEHTPATLVSTQALTQIHSHLQPPLNELTAFVSNKNAGHISNAAAQIEQNVLQYLWGFTPQVQTLAQPAFSGILEAQAASSRETIHQLSTQRDELAAKLNDLSEKAEAQELRLEALSESPPVY